MFLKHLKKMIFPLFPTSGDYQQAESIKKKIPWAYPWAPVGEGGKGLIGELHREICEKHVLFEKKVIPIGHGIGNDDVLFKILPDGYYAVVHLTWQGKENSPIWPCTVLFKDLDDWLKNGLTKDKKWHEKIRREVRKER